MTWILTSYGRTITRSPETAWTPACPPKRSSTGVSLTGATVSHETTGYRIELWSLGDCSARINSPHAGLLGGSMKEPV